MTERSSTPKAKVKKPVKTSKAEKAPKGDVCGQDAVDIEHQGDAMEFWSTPMSGQRALQGYRSAMGHMISGGSEFASFASKRFKKNFATMNAFAACRTPVDFSDVWFSAASSTLHDYADEFDRLTEVYMNGLHSGEDTSDQDEA